MRVDRNLGPGQGTIRIKAQEMEVFKGEVEEIVRKKVIVAIVRSQVRRRGVHRAPVHLLHLAHR